MPQRGRQVAILVLRRTEGLPWAEASGWAGALLAQSSEPLRGPAEDTETKTSRCRSASVASAWPERRTSFWS